MFSKSSNEILQIYSTCKLELFDFKIMFVMFVYDYIQHHHSLNCHHYHHHDKKKIGQSVFSIKLQISNQNIMQLNQLRFTNLVKGQISSVLNFEKVTKNGLVIKDLTYSLFFNIFYLITLPFHWFISFSWPQVFILIFNFQY